MQLTETEKVAVGLLAERQQEAQAAYTRELQSILGRATPLYAEIEKRLEMEEGAIGSTHAVDAEAGEVVELENEA